MEPRYYLLLALAERLRMTPLRAEQVFEDVPTAALQTLVSEV